MKLSIISSLAVVFLSQSVFSQKCLQTVDLGFADCTEYMTKYYYDKDTNTCEMFEFSGCGGNDNKFDTLLDCELACVLFDQSPDHSHYPVDIYNPFDTHHQFDVYHQLDSRRPVGTDLLVDALRLVLGRGRGLSGGGRGGRGGRGDRGRGRNNRRRIGKKNRISRKIIKRIRKILPRRNSLRGVFRTDSKTQTKPIQTQPIQIIYKSD